MLTTIIETSGPTGLVALVAAILLLIIVFYRIPQMAVYLYLASICVPGLAIFTIGSNNVRADDVIVILGAISAFIRYRFIPFTAQPRETRLVLGIWALIHFIQYGMLTTFVVMGKASHVSWYDAMRGIHCALQLALFITAIKTREDVVSLFKVFAIVLMIAVPFTVPRLSRDPFQESVGLYEAKTAISMVQGAAGFHPAAFGALGRFLVITGMYMVLLKRKPFFGIAIGLGAWVLIWFIFRTDVYSTLFMVLFFLLLESRRRLGVAIVISIAMVIVAIFFVYDDALFARLTVYLENFRPTQLSGREEQFPIGVRLALENLPFGVGPFLSDYTMWMATRGAWPSIHNSYLIVIVETGIIVFPLLVLMVILLGRQLVAWAQVESEGRFYLAMYVTWLAVLAVGPDIFRAKLRMIEFSVIMAALGTFGRSGFAQTRDATICEGCPNDSGARVSQSFRV